MAFCLNCGQPIDDDAAFCGACGANQATGAVAQADFPQADFPQEDAPAETQPNPFNEFLQKVQAWFARFNDTPDYTQQYDPADAQGGKVMAILAYISWLVLIPLFVEKKSRFARFHTNQGLILFALSTAYGIATGVFCGLLGLLSGVLSALFGWLFGIAGLVFLAYMVLGIVNAATGKAKELPIIGKYQILN